MVRIEWGYQFKTQPREHPTEETIKRKAQSCHDDDSVRHCVEAHCRLNIYIYNTQHAYILYMRMLCRRCVCIRHGNHSIDTNNRRYIKLLERIAELFFLYSFFYSTLQTSCCFCHSPIQLGKNFDEANYPFHLQFWMERRSFAWATSHRLIRIIADPRWKFMSGAEKERIRRTKFNMTKSGIYIK